MFYRLTPVLFLCFFLLACQEKGYDSATEKYPWQITVTADGGSQVFGIHLKKTSMAEAQHKLGGRPDIALFENRDGRLAVEVYYKEFTRGGLSGNLLLTLVQEETLFQQLKTQAQGKKQLESGVVKYFISDGAVRQLGSVPISGVTYVPYANLDEEMIKARFGVPAQKIKTHAQAQHWLYPEKGLDLIINTEGKEILQYVSPREFDGLVRPLQP